MSAAIRPASDAGLVFWAAPLLGATLICAPLVKGGNRPLPLLVLELTALALLAACIGRSSLSLQLSWRFLALLAGVVALPLIQLIPLAEPLWSLVPGRGFYAAAFAAIGGESAARAASLVPRATEAALLTLLPPLAVFLVTVSLHEHATKRMAYVFVAVAVGQAILGLAQFGTGSVAVLWFGEGLHVDSALGTYANRDHLAGLLEMALPVALALVAANVQGPAGMNRQHHRRGLRHRLARLFALELRINRAALYAAASLAILLGLVFTRSRTGVALGMLGILLCALLFARKIGGERSAGMATVFSVIGLALAAEIGLAPVIDRFVSQNVAMDSRWSIFDGTLAGVGAFFPFGSGMGTFPDVFRRFQPGDVSLFVNHAHNDYLEWLFEGGLIAAALIASFVFVYLRGWVRMWTREPWAESRFVQAAAGIGLLLIGLHGLVDFNLHIPANAVYFAFLAGVFLHREAPKPQQVRDRTERAPRSATAARPEPFLAPLPQEVRNPFAD